MQTQTPVRLSLPAEKGADIDLNAPSTKKLLDLLASKHIVSYSTVAFEDNWTLRADCPSRMFAPILSRLPPQLQRETLTGALPSPKGWTRSSSSPSSGPSSS